MWYLLLIAALLAVAFLVIGTPVSNNLINAIHSNSRKRHVCREKECIAIAKSLLSNIDPSVDPCDDFYEFACGRYSATNSIPDNKFEISATTVIQDMVQLQLKQALEEPISDDEQPHFTKLKFYYRACIDSETAQKRGLTPMKEIIKSVGGWPVVDGKNSEDRSWQSVLCGLRMQKLKASYLFKQYVDSDYKHSGERIIAIQPPSYKIDHDILFQGKSHKNVQAYLKFMLGISQLFGATEEVARKDMEDVLDFEINLAKSSKSLAQKRANFTALYNKYTVEMLENEFPKFPWLSYIDVYTPKNFTVTRDLEIMVTEPEYVTALIDLLEITPNRVVVNYFIWRATYGTVKYLSEDARTIEQHFISSVLGHSKRKERYKECIDDMEENLLPLVSSLYVRKFFNPRTQQVVSEMIRSLKDTFKTILNETDWSADDKVHAIDKVEALNELAGNPNWLVDDAKLAKYYGMLEVTQENFMRSALEIESFNEKFFYGGVPLPVSYSNAAIVNAYYLPTTNSIVFPAAILQGVYFQADRPKYINFATIGSVIGHEMSHGFDEVGHQFDIHGDLKNAWSVEANKDFQERKKCIINQFNRYATRTGQHVNGALTVGENLADFGGQQIAYLSYEKWLEANGEEPGLPGLNYTNRQLYWIASASIWCENERPESTQYKISTNPHSPSEFRVDGPLKNLQIFSRDYNCPVGSKMNPVDKCQPL